MDSCIKEDPKVIRKRFEESIEEMIELAQAIETGQPDEKEKKTASDEKSKESSKLLLNKGKS